MKREQLAPAKINIGLRILSKRSDGFHDLETVFVGIPWFDRITVEKADRLHMTCNDPALPTDERNLCMQAALALSEHLKQDLRVHIHLDKYVPYGAGLGSGSSDAAATLLLLNGLVETPVTKPVLHELAAALGSDVAFFLDPVAAVGTGRGEVLTPLGDALGLSAPYAFPFALVVAVPDCHVSTAAAYQDVVPRSGYEQSLAEIVATNDVAIWAEQLTNDFERSILPAFPPVAVLKRRLSDLGAGLVMMSGSGAAVFGVFSRDEVAQAAWAALDREGYRGRCFDRATMQTWWQKR